MQTRKSLHRGIFVLSLLAASTLVAQEAVPSTALVRISRKTYRLMRRNTGNYAANSFRHVRSGNDGQLRLLFFRRMQFEIVD